MSYTLLSMLGGGLIGVAVTIIMYKRPVWQRLTVACLLTIGVMLLVTAVAVGGTH